MPNQVIEKLNNSDCPTLGFGIHQTKDHQSELNLEHEFLMREITSILWWWLCSKLKDFWFTFRIHIYVIFASEAVLCVVRRAPEYITLNHLNGFARRGCIKGFSPQETLFGRAIFLIPAA